MYKNYNHKTPFAVKMIVYLVPLGLGYLVLESIGITIPNLGIAFLFLAAALAVLSQK